MPGVPFEMEHIMQVQVMPLLKSSSNANAIVYETIATVGEGESVLSERIADIEQNLPVHVKIAYLPAPGRVRLRVTGHGTDQQVLLKEVSDIANNIASRIGEFIYSREDIQLADAIGKRLRERKQTVSVAESCTGGFISHLFTANAGSSDYFKGGGITYSNELKQSILGVKDETLASYGAVSEETVKEMAAGAVKAFQTDYAIAVSGIAGPDGGTAEKPVGTVWIAVADSQSIVTKKFTFGKDRLRNIEMSAICALDMLRKKLG
jgi:nicotinamide-nucleotide amidase